MSERYEEELRRAALRVADTRGDPLDLLSRTVKLGAKDALALADAVEALRQLRDLSPAGMRRRAEVGAKADAALARLDSFVSAGRVAGDER